MTYGVGIMLDRGLVFMSDTRTNSGLDNINQYRKMFNWSVPGERTITMLAAGNLATTQTVAGLLNDRTTVPKDRSPSILEAPTMFQVAQLVGQTLAEAVADHGQQASESRFSATLILGGQIGTMDQRLFLIYPEGNFIEAGQDTSYLQIGETKYGKPIIVRALKPDMSFENAIKLLLVSFDSTMKANLSVGAPLDLHVYERDSLMPGTIHRIEADDPYFLSLSDRWSESLSEAFNALPDFELNQ